MRAGADAIVQAPLGSPTFFGIADVLLRTDTPSALGAHSYEPVDTKLAAETKAGALLQLLTYCELLGSMQDVIPAPEQMQKANGMCRFREVARPIR